MQGRIQVPERCMHVLTKWYTFEMRGSIFVKESHVILSFDKNGAVHLESVPFAQDVQAPFK